MPAAPRARAVAEAPVDALVARADELARRWAIALILTLPLDRLGELPLQDFAREAPGLCAQVVRALQSDAELERIAAAGAPGVRGDGGSVRRLGELTGAHDCQAAVEAVEALRGVVWEALLDELRWPSFEPSPARQVADLADRLAYVCSTALASALTPSVAGARASGEALAAAEREPPFREPPFREPPFREPPSITEPAHASARTVLGDGFVIVDEGESARRRSAPSRAPASPRTAPAASDARPTRARPLPWDIPLDGERSVGATSRAVGADAAGGGAPGVVRVTRGSAAAPDPAPEDPGPEGPRLEEPA